MCLFCHDDAFPKLFISFVLYYKRVHPCAWLRMEQQKS